MTEQPQILFAPFRFELAQEQLWRETTQVPLRPKSTALLRYFLEHPGQIISKQELLHAVWPDTIVSEWTLTTGIRELRVILGDAAQTPQYIETVHRRGYRFIAPLSTNPAPVSSSQFQAPSSETRHSVLDTQYSVVVGREAELAQLHGWLAKALSGERQLVFVRGELGIGKTTVVDAFLAQLQGNPQPWIGRGQCIEHYGASEAYLPVLEAFGRLCLGPDGQQCIGLLRRYAPTWLAQMPALLSATEFTTLQQRVAGTTRERMLREMVEAVEALTAQHALILWLEDLHWSDASTLDWLAFVARRREPARLLVIGSYRPLEVNVRDHPLKAVTHELQLHGYCEELLLSPLTEKDVARYLSGQREGLDFPPALARAIHQRTDGNPLFLVNVLEYLRTRGMLIHSEASSDFAEEICAVEASVPEGLRRLIEYQIDQLSPTIQRMLEAASVAGVEFSAAAVAAGSLMEEEHIEEQCTQCVRLGSFLHERKRHEWPDGTLSAGYGFLHALYQEVLYERTPTRRRQQLHQRIGERLESAYGVHARQIGAELALHFEQGRNFQRAVHYYGLAAENAAQRNAPTEALSLLTQGLEKLQTLPVSKERDQQELSLQITLGGVLMATRGYADPQAERAYARASELCQTIGERQYLFPALHGLARFYGVGGVLPQALELGEQLLKVAESEDDPALIAEASLILGVPLFWGGELTTAREHLERCVTLSQANEHRRHAVLYGQEPSSAGGGFAAITLWCLGYQDQAQLQINKAIASAKQLSHAFSLAGAMAIEVMLYQVHRELPRLQGCVKTFIALSREQEFGFFLAWGTIIHGWLLAKQGQGEQGIIQMRHGLERFRATGAQCFLSYFLVLFADAYGAQGQIEDGMAALTEAGDVVLKTGERFYEAELYRLKGELTLQSQASPGQVSDKSQASPGQVSDKSQTSPGQVSSKSQTSQGRSKTNPQAEAEGCFLKALDIARRQQAKSLELRAAISLARLWQQQGKRQAARDTLAEVYNWFTEGFDTKDLQEASTLIEEPK